MPFCSIRPKTAQELAEGPAIRSSHKSTPRLPASTAKPAALSLLLVTDVYWLRPSMSAAAAGGADRPRDRQAERFALGRRRYICEKWMQGKGCGRLLQFGCRERHPEWEPCVYGDGYLNLVQENMCRNFRRRDGCVRDRNCRLSHDDFQTSRLRLPSRDRDYDWVNDTYRREVQPDYRNVRGASVQEANMDRRPTPLEEDVRRRSAEMPEADHISISDAEMSEEEFPPTQLYPDPVQTPPPVPYKAAPSKKAPPPPPPGPLFPATSDASARDVTPPPPAFRMRQMGVRPEHLQDGPPPPPPRRGSPTPSFRASSPRWRGSTDEAPRPSLAPERHHSPERSNKIPGAFRLAQTMTTSWPNNTSLADLDFPVDDQTDAGSEVLAGPVRDRPIRTWTWTPTGAATNEILIAVHRDLCLCKTIEERRHCYQLARRFFTPVSTMPQCLYLVLFDVYEHLPAIY